MSNSWSLISLSDQIFNVKKLALCFYQSPPLQRGKVCFHDRLATGARMLRWNRGETGVCYLCTSCIESRDHLFFACSYSAEVWEALARGLFQHHYTSDWTHLLTIVSAQRKDRVVSFLMKYIFQTTVYTIWHERNRRRHDEAPKPAANLIQWIDKQMRNRITTIQRQKDRPYEASFQRWLQSRS